MSEKIIKMLRSDSIYQLLDDVGFRIGKNELLKNESNSSLIQSLKKLNIIADMLHKELKMRILEQ
jgi:hypothetical protein